MEEVLHSQEKLVSIYQDYQNFIVKNKILP